MYTSKQFTKENLDLHFRELAKEFKKRNRNRITVEMTLVGGAAVLVNYGFRDMTYDVDAIIQPSGLLKDEINAVGDRLELPTGWLNTDFIKTASYTSKLIAYSKYYKTFSNVLTVRTISGAYLVAMKLMSGRIYKNDLSDVLGILIEHENREDSISLDMIRSAIEDLYGSYENIPESSREFIESVYNRGDIRQQYTHFREMEIGNKEVLLKFQDAYPGVMNKSNIQDIINAARAKKAKEGEDSKK